MKPIVMPALWHNQFVGLKITSGHRFRISKTALTDSIMAVANFAIDIADGIVIKNRYGTTGQSDEFHQEEAKRWPILHERRFGAGVVHALERSGALGPTPQEDRAAMSAYNHVYGIPAVRTAVALSDTDGIS